MADNILNDENLIQDFIDITIEVLSTMANLDVKSKGVREINGGTSSLDVTACMDITGVLGFSGGRRGSLLVTFANKTALKAVGGMLGIECKEVNADIRDGVGELVNMIAGGAKTKLQSKGIDFELSIPNTVIGANHQITSPLSTSRTRLDFTTSEDDFFMEVYLKQQ